MTRRCTCCRSPLRIAECRNVRPMIYEGICYLLIAECPACVSTQAWVMYSVPDEVLEEQAEKAA